MTKITEDSIEQTALDWLESLGYEISYGPDIAFDGSTPERDEQANYADVVLVGRLRSALEQINPTLPTDAIDEAIRKVTRPESPSLIENNRAFQKALTEGVDVSWMGADGEKHDKVWLADSVNPENNNWLAVNQFTIIEDKRQRRPDIVLFVNGLPLVVIELKNAADENATIRNAFNQLQTYKEQIPSLFIYNQLLIISDGMQARAGTLTAGWDRFMPWRTIDGTDLYREPGSEKQSDGVMQPGLETVLKGMFDRKRFLDYCPNFITFEDEGGDTTTIAKKAAGYHQYHAVNKAVKCTLEATAESGDRRIGVIWHTQGSGKSLSMVFYAGKIIKDAAMENPTVVLLTDRNDLDDQLFGTFSANKDLLRQTPVQAESRANLRELLTVSSGGVIFTTIQKFLREKNGDGDPELSARRNIVVIADEAHRSQYDFIDGLARHMHDALPNASFIGFTGTPIESADKNTRAVFGDYIDKYDILRAVEDGATVPIYYESRLARIELNEDERPTIDPEFEEITEGEEEESRKQRMRTKWASIEAMVGTEKRIGLVAADLVEHFEARQETMDGKALIVCMSRRICVDMYNALIKLRPGWHGDDDTDGKIKIVMSGSASDELSWQSHIRTKRAREAMAKRYKDAKDELKIVIVRDMWLTGFDCPSMHTMYVDKPMNGHNLMQAIARVNRVFHDKPGGRVVDYLGLADALKRALANYTESGGKGDATINQEEAVAVMLEKYEIVCDLLHGFDYSSIVKLSGGERMSGIAQMMEFILELEDRKKNYLQFVTTLS
ncbi:MAG: type I restriction endonuclease subunit R, partial [candidate division Zixibacteria bacterium]|nr:type I restriction endonuclease subunit R [candidate division Zixibacteria bacterium]